MLSKALLKDVKALHNPKFRQMYDNFIAEGEKVCKELLEHRKFEINKIFVTQGFNSFDLPSHLAKHTYVISEKEMDQISALKTPTNILLVLKIQEDFVEIPKGRTTKIIYLDGVQDPGNLGTIIRIADWFGIDFIIRSPKCADFFNPKTIQATMGSIANVGIGTSSLENLKSLNIPIWGTSMAGEDLIHCQMPTSCILVMGSEGSGISAENQKLIDFWVTIQGSTNKLAESLNVSIATGIICAKWFNY
jgi:TrmH family RNA methyltransferase